MRTYLVVLCLLVSTLALSQRYRDSILVNNGPWASYKSGTFVFGEDTIPTKKIFVDSLVNCLDFDSDNFVIVNGRWTYYMGTGNTGYYDYKKYGKEPAFIRNNVRRKINKWIREKKLAH
jgi:hypothetical protein